MQKTFAILSRAAPAMVGGLKSSVYPSFGLFGPFLATLATLAHFGENMPLGSTTMLIEATLIPNFRFPPFGQCVAIFARCCRSLPIFCHFAPFLTILATVLHFSPIFHPFHCISPLCTPFLGTIFDHFLAIIAHFRAIWDLFRPFRAPLRSLMTPTAAYDAQYSSTQDPLGPPEGPLRPPNGL